MKTWARALIFTISLAAASSASAKNYAVCTAIKNMCVGTVKLFTETISVSRVDGLLQCQALKSDCNDLFGDIGRGIDRNLDKAMQEKIKKDSRD